MVQGSEDKYGNCEGPNSQYIKLISSDGQEFIVKREHALRSGTIRAMLSGPCHNADNEKSNWNTRVPHRAGNRHRTTVGRQLFRLLTSFEGSTTE
ncbi:unnamed protein product [Macrosiphum euphorbiae]|uniref:SKP1 component POZ domain-containing protein n=1 Tax=Macrosiphum euphorbiae TaxID=13131 RepID=A0AAV0YDI9_9HEMI|nr:unnamed protein product [Macrosiphum euphorbiae]